MQLISSHAGERSRRGYSSEATRRRAERGRRTAVDFIAAPRFRLHDSLKARVARVHALDPDDVSVG